MLYTVAVTQNSHVIPNTNALVPEKLIAGPESVNLEKAGVLTHPEHKPVEIPAGSYEVGRVQEYNVAEGTEQQVHD